MCDHVTAVAYRVAAELACHQAVVFVVCVGAGTGDAVGAGERQLDVGGARGRGHAAPCHQAVLRQRRRQATLVVQRALAEVLGYAA